MPFWGAIRLRTNTGNYVSPVKYTGTAPTLGTISTPTATVTDATTLTISVTYTPGTPIDGLTKCFAWRGWEPYYEPDMPIDWEDLSPLGPIGFNPEDATEDGIHFSFPVTIPENYLGDMYFAVRFIGPDDTEVTSDRQLLHIEPVINSSESPRCLASLGNSELGSTIPTTGVLHNLKAEPTAPGSVNILWDYQGNTPSTILIYSDGIPVARTPSDTNITTVSGLSEGIHTFAHTTLAPWQSHATAMVDLLGQRVTLSWQPGASDTKAYNIYRNDELVATLTDTVLKPLIEATSVSRGRVSVIGESNIPSTISIAIVAEGECEITLTTPSGTTTTTYQFIKGTQLTLSNGVIVLFHDPPYIYSTSDEFSTYVAVETRYLTDLLAPGTYTFGITALDEAGNESVPVETNPIRIIEIPPAVTNVEVTPTEITFIPPAGIDGTRLYTNYNVHTKKLLPYIVVDQAPQDTTAGNKFTINIEDSGEFKFYLRTVKNGIESPEITMYSITLPDETPTNIVPPTNLTARPLADGKWQVSFEYIYSDDNFADGFNVYASSTDIDYDTDLITTIPITSNVGFPVMTFSYSHDDSDTGTVNIAVRTTYNGTEEKNTNFVTIELDDTPPAFFGPVIGGPV